MWELLLKVKSWIIEHNIDGTGRCSSTNPYVLLFYHDNYSYFCWLNQFFSEKDDPRIKNDSLFPTDARQFCLLCILSCQKGHSYLAKCEAWQMAICFKKQFWENIPESQTNEPNQRREYATNCNCNCFHCYHVVGFGMCPADALTKLGSEKN